MAAFKGQSMPLVDSPAGVTSRPTPIVFKPSQKAPKLDNQNLGATKSDIPPAVNSPNYKWSQQNPSKPITGKA
jgi:hypothetical protein